MPTYQQRLTTNNLKIDEITAMARNLPDEGDTKPYIELEYIQSNGLQYIDTGIKPKSTTFINFMGTFLQKNGVLMGSRVDGDIDKYYVTTYYNDLAFNYDNNSSVSNVTFGSANVYDITSTYWRLDGQVVNNYSINNFPNYSIFLFALNSSGNTTAYATGRIYYFKIYENNVLVRNFIPVRRKRDGEVCLYDLVNNMFFTNQGTSGFVAGPEKVESTMNIFVQTTEPTIKKGIWLQTDETMEHIYAEEDMVSDETWYPDGTFTDLPYHFTQGAVTSVGNKIYMFGNGYQLDNYKQYAYMFDIDLNSYTRLTDVPYRLYAGKATSVGTDIYLFGGVDTSATMVYAYKYNTLNDTYTRLTDIPYNFYNGCVATVGTDIYLFGTDYDSGDMRNRVYKYDTLTDTYTRLNNMPVQCHTGEAVANNTDIYIIGGYPEDYKQKLTRYNTLTDTYTSCANLPDSFIEGAAGIYHNNIYIARYDNNSIQNMYRYNISNDTYTSIQNPPNIIYGTDGVVINNRIFFVGGAYYLNGYRTYTDKVQCLYLTDDTYLDNSLIISQNNKLSGGYNVELYSNNKNQVPPKYPFSNAWFYTTNDGLITDIPSYYGNGTQWINFKTPSINNENEE